jgi:putative membrane protein
MGARRGISRHAGMGPVKAASKATAAPSTGPTADPAPSRARCHWGFAGMAIAEAKPMSLRTHLLVAGGAFALLSLQCKGTSPYPLNTPIVNESEGAAAPGSAGPARPTPQTAPSSTSPSISTPSTSSEPVPAGPAASAGAAKPRTETRREARLDDAQIAAITAAINNAEVEQGHLARAQATDPSVRDFASMMVDHHEQARREQQSLSLPLAGSPDSERLTQESNAAFQSLQHKHGADFDRAYVALQIEEHTNVLNVLQRDLLPNAKDERLEAYLRKLIPTVETHLAQAQRLQQDLGAAHAGAGSTADGRAASR